MSVENLPERMEGLIDHMGNMGYSAGYIIKLKTEINWLVRNGWKFDSYEEACEAREKETDSQYVRHGYKAAYGIFWRYDLLGEYPDRRTPGFPRGRGAYFKLLPGFRAAIDAFRRSEDASDLEESTVDCAASSCSCFMLAMQERGCLGLGDVTEGDVIAHFTDDATGEPAFSRSYSRNVTTVLAAELGDITADARRVLAMLPSPPRRRKNVQYLRAEEAEAVDRALDDPESGLCLRDRAIGRLLLNTGMRASDVAALSFGDIDWSLDEMRMKQRKTGAPLTLPLTAEVGNAILDYVELERPEGGSDRVFLSRDGRRAPISGGTVYIARTLTTDGPTNVVKAALRSMDLSLIQSSRSKNSLVKSSSKDITVSRSSALITTSDLGSGTRLPEAAGIQSAPSHSSQLTPRATPVDVRVLNTSSPSSVSYP